MPNFYEPFASRYAAGVREGCKRGGRGVGMGVCGDWAGPLYTAAAGLTPATLLGCIFARRRWIRALTLARSRPPNKTSREETRRCRTGLFLFAAFFPASLFPPVQRPTLHYAALLSLLSPAVRRPNHNRRLFFFPPLCFSILSAFERIFPR